MRDLLTKIQCWFIGWDYNLLKECSTASRKALCRYTNAIVLLMLIWAYIGYTMAGRYFNIENSFAKIMVAIVFSFVVWTIERQIILITGKHWTIFVFRLTLAIIMATLGATIIDQDLYHADIKAEREKRIEEITDSLYVKKEAVFRQKKEYIKATLDSLERKAHDLNLELSKNHSVSLYSRQFIGIDSTGQEKYANNRESVLNPKYKELEHINSIITAMNDSTIALYAQQQDIRNDSRLAAEESIGLLTELNLMFSRQVVFKSPTSIIFYFGVLGFFLIIELLVVVGKYISGECDYEVLIEKQQKLKIKQIESTLPLDNNSKK